MQIQSIGYSSLFQNNSVARTKKDAGNFSNTHNYSAEYMDTVTFQGRTRNYRGYVLSNDESKCLRLLESAGDRFNNLERIRLMCTIKQFKTEGEKAKMLWKVLKARNNNHEYLLEAWQIEEFFDMLSGQTLNAQKGAINMLAWQDDTILAERNGYSLLYFSESGTGKFLETVGMLEKSLRERGIGETRRGQIIGDTMSLVDMGDEKYLSLAPKVAKIVENPAAREKLLFSDFTWLANEGYSIQEMNKYLDKFLLDKK